MTQVISDVSGGTDWTHNPEQYLQTKGAYAEELKRGRKALEDSGAHSITFFYVGKPDTDGFLEPISDYDATKDQPVITTYKFEDEDAPTPMCFPPEDYYEITWQGPDLIVTEWDATLRWTEEHGTEELLVDVDES
jgi:hypothetical protein